MKPQTMKQSIRALVLVVVVFGTLAYAATPKALTSDLPQFGVALNVPTPGGPMPLCPPSDPNCSQGPITSVAVLSVPTPGGPMPLCPPSDPTCSQGPIVSVAVLTIPTPGGPIA